MSDMMMCMRCGKTDALRMFLHDNDDGHTEQYCDCSPDKKDDHSSLWVFDERSFRAAKFIMERVIAIVQNRYHYSPKTLAESEVEQHRLMSRIIRTIERECFE